MPLVNGGQFAKRNLNFQKSYYHRVDEQSIVEKRNENIQVNQMFYLTS